MLNLFFANHSSINTMTLMYCSISLLFYLVVQHS